MITKFNRQLVKGFLHTSGTKIVNGEGQEIILNGYGHGNWTNPEGFMVGAPTQIVTEGGVFSPKPLPLRRFDRRRTFHQVLVELCGTEYARDFWNTWYKNQLDKADFEAMAQLGVNCIRLPINAVTLLAEEPGIVWNDEGFEMLDRVLDLCETYGIYAILDLHGAPGGQSGTPCDGGLDNLPHLFMDDESRERALLLWERLAQRYCGRWIVGAYDLLNEPLNLPNHRGYVPELARFYDEAVARIRRLDKKHMITLEGSSFSRSNEIFDHDYDPECHNWCIQVHMYDASPQRRELYPYLLKGMELNVPVWIGEGGSDAAGNSVFFEIAADYGIGFCLWSWKMALDQGMELRGVGYHLPKDWEAVRGYCAGGPKPSYKRSMAIFDELLENIRYENCVHNKDFYRVSRRIPPMTLPAVGYDNMPGNGYSFIGGWDYGNLLDYRLEDHTKLVWTPGIEEPRPRFDIYEDENNQEPQDPLRTLMLELSAGEFAVYTVRFVKPGCYVTLNGMGLPVADISVFCEDVLAGNVQLPGAFTDYEARVPLTEGEAVRIKILVNCGCVWLKELKFEYGE